MDAPLSGVAVLAVEADVAAGVVALEARFARRARERGHLAAALLHALPGLPGGGVVAAVVAHGAAALSCLPPP